MLLKGEYRIHEIGGTIPPWRRNLALVTAAHIAARCIGQGDMRYRVSKVYVEFANGADDPVPVPDFDAQDGIDYYNGLASSPDRDYVRAALNPMPVIDLDPEAVGRLDPEHGNRVIFEARLGSVVGVHGKPFSDSAGSRVYGIALVAAPVEADPTRDLVFARGYYPPERQILKTSRDLGVTYRYAFTVPE
jgi:hypothetical protein